MDKLRNHKLIIYNNLDLSHEHIDLFTVHGWGDWGQIGKQEKELSCQEAGLRQWPNFKLTLPVVWYS